MLYLLSGVCIGCLIGSIVERVISFAKLRSEISETTKYPAAAVGVAALAACAVVTPGEYGVPGGYTTTGGHFSGCLAVDGDSHAFFAYDNRLVDDPQTGVRWRPEACGQPPDLGEPLPLEADLWPWFYLPDDEHTVWQDGWRRPWYPPDPPGTVPANTLWLSGATWATDSLFVDGRNGGTMHHTAGQVWPAIPGDLNWDQRVDMDDFALLKQNFGHPNPTWWDGDFDGDGDVDLDDLSALKRNMGRGPPAASPASP